MSADLEHVNGKPELSLTTSEFSSKLTKTILNLYVFTLITILLGIWIALYQNWTVRLEDAHSRLVRSANVANFLVETALADAEKSLDNTQASFEKAIAEGHMSHQLARKNLETSYAKFKTYNKADAFGLLFFVDKNGKLYAQSEGEANTSIDFSNRFYFYKLRENPNLKRTVGPLVLAKTTGQWVFHMSIPVYGPHHQFEGALVQQILVHDIARKLNQYADTSYFEEMMAHYNGSAPSFIFPPPGTSASPRQNHSSLLTHTKASMTEQNFHSENLLMGFAKSPVYELETYATLPYAKIKHDFLMGNLYFILYVFVGLLLSAATFYYLYDLSKRLAKVQMESLHDPLTRLHNRRALDDVLPTLLRDATRQQNPISVLFIDIDHFRFFNENYGHESGDIALKAVAQTLSSCVHRPLDFVCRWGGEEFVIVLPQTNREAARKIADDILNAIRQIELRCNTNGDHPRLTVSIGHVTSNIARNAMPEDLVDAADKAMLQAKSQGRNQRVESALKS